MLKSSKIYTPSTSEEMHLTDDDDVEAQAKGTMVTRLTNIQGIISLAMATVDGISSAITESSGSDKGAMAARSRSTMQKRIVYLRWPPASY